jgi:serine/threonine protein kinase
VKKPIQFGKYLLLDRINVGGMAEVFKAKAFGVEGFERLVAVKRILPNIAEDGEFIEMFIDEAKIAVQLSHANIAQIFDLGKAEDSYFIALEFVQGKDLRAIFDRCKQKPSVSSDGTSAMALGQACFIIMKACEGLDYAHNKKDAMGNELHLVHRDVSPQNILISYEGEVKLIDFGIAKAAGKASKTQQGILKGKFGYMSPEQVRGLPLDRRSDIFSLGIVLYELLTAERLFVGESDFSTLEKVRNVEILPPSTYNRRIPEELERIVLKALAKDVEDRYQNAIDLHDDLQAFMYTAGEFYARKDLGGWMKRVYDEEIRAEQARIESYQRLPAIASPTPQTPIPVDRPRRPSGQMFAASAATTPPPPPAQALAQRTSSQMPVVSPSRAPDKPVITDLPLVVPTAASGSMAENGALSPTSPVGPIGSAGTTDLHANGHANGHTNGSSLSAATATAGSDLAWDDEELATNIYDDKAENADDSIVSDLPASRPDLSRVELSVDGAPVPATNRIEPPTKLTSPAFTASYTGTDMRAQRPVGPPMGLLLGVGAMVLGAFALVGGYLYLGGRPGQIQVTSEPASGLQILVDNQRVPVDATPATIARAPGTYALIVQHEGYVPYSDTVEIKSREMVRKHIVLEPLTSGTGFKLAEPIGAQVYLDGKLLDGQTPLQVQSVMPGKHKVEVRGTYGAWIEDVQLEAGKMTELHPVFPGSPMLPGAPHPMAASPAPPGSPPTASPPTALPPTAPPPTALPPTAPPPTASPPAAPPPTASLQGTAPPARPAHPTESLEPVRRPPALPPARTPSEPVVRERPTRAPSEPVARPRPPKRAPSDDEGEAAPAPRASERASSGGEGYLRINSKPWTNISIDGKDTGLHTPQTQLKLSAGSHRVMLANPQFGIRETFSVTIGAGLTETVIKDLRPKDTQDAD